MSEHNRDTHLLQAIAGDDDPGSLGIQIEENYLERERMENAREQGFKVPARWRPRTTSTKEVAIWVYQRQMEEIEAERVNLPQTPYDGGGEDNMEDTKITKLKFFTYYGTLEGEPEGAKKHPIINHVDITPTIRITYTPGVIWKPNTKGERQANTIIETINEVDPVTKQPLKELKRVVHTAVWEKQWLQSALDVPLDLTCKREVVVG